jgi:hypothetical protein
MKKKIVFLIFILLFSLLANALPVGQLKVEDSVRVSLITCAPGAEIYNLFGHTAIRYRNVSKNMDVVFNYGMFDFRKPHFVFRFTLGQTDYELGVENYQEFVDNYAMHERSVEEQVLNLTSVEKEKLYELLLVNYMPQNRTYRYNFFYDNCSTRPRDKIEECIDGKVVYAPFKASKTFRKLIHEYTAGHPWDEFGIDLLIGAGADKPITQRQMMFIPFYLRDFVQKASITGKSGKRVLVAKKEKVVICNTTRKEGFSLTPFQCALLLLALSIFVSIYELKRKRTVWMYDVVLYGIAGIAGCIIAFLMLFSTHPTVGSNFLILVFHPFYLFCLPWIILSERTGRKSLPARIILVVLTLFIVFGAFIPQKFGVTVVLLTLSLWIRLASHSVLAFKNKK